jgi:hypothetical protein
VKQSGHLLVARGIYVLKRCARTMLSFVSLAGGVGLAFLGAAAGIARRLGGAATMMARRHLLMTLEVFDTGACSAFHMFCLHAGAVMLCKSLAAY